MARKEPSRNPAKFLHGRTAARLGLRGAVKGQMMASNFLEELPKRIFIGCLVLVSLVGAFLYGAFAYRNKLPPIPQLKVAYRTMTTVADNDLTSHPRRHHLQPSRGGGKGVTVRMTPDDGALVFMAGFFDEENQIRLIRRDGTLVRKWSLDYFDHFPDPDTRVCDVVSPLRVDTHGAHVTPQGEVVFNYDYCGTVKLDQCGKLLWRIGKPTHHSLVPAEAGGYWLLGRDVWLASELPDRLPPFSTPAKEQLMQEDTVLLVSEEGDVLEEFSIPALMRGNGLEALLTANGANFDSDTIRRTELVHANKVAELPSKIAASYPLFAAGDLALSMRQLNLVIVLDPVNKKVKWHQTGPWIRQHDPEFRPDGRLSIFNNNVYRTAYPNEQINLNTPYTTNIIAIDPVSRETEVIFGERPGQEMLSAIRGQHELLEHGGLLITEFDAGRVLEVDADGRILWEYVNYYDDEFVGEIANSELLPADYFQVEWEACEQ